MAELEEAVNEALARYIPKGLLKEPLEVAVDLTEVPYYGGKAFCVCVLALSLSA